MKVALVVLDTLRKDAISPYDGAVDYTDNLDSFADEATVYETAIAQSPWSLPSQASILTGQYPWQHGAGQSRPYLEPTGQLLQQRLQRAGYRTAAIHENPWIAPATGAMAGFETVATPADWTTHLTRLWRGIHAVPGGRTLAKRVAIALSEYRHRSALSDRTDSSWFLDRTSQFLAEHADDDFFLYLNPLNAHYPYAPPRSYVDKHGIDATCADLDSRPVEYGGRPVSSELGPLRTLYAAEVDYLDDVFGRLRALFRARGIAEETTFVVCADHGELLGEADLLGHHFSVRPEVTEVPLFVSKPGNSGGRESGPTELRELYYEVLHAAGLDAADEERLVDGRAAGLYDTPQIYSERLPSEMEHRAVPRFYHVGEDDRETSVEIGRSIGGSHTDAVRETIALGRRRRDAFGVPDLD